MCDAWAAADDEVVTVDAAAAATVEDDEDVATAGAEACLQCSSRKWGGSVRPRGAGWSGVPQ